jgi:hypothetical protein
MKGNIKNLENYCKDYICMYIIGLSLTHFGHLEIVILQVKLSSTQSEIIQPSKYLLLCVRLVQALL